jgi:sigma-B regulation protein RsbU (phosphoserine phosphatase)
MAKFEFRFLSNTAYLGVIRKLVPSVTSYISNLNFGSADRYKCTLALVEAFNNAVFHAHKSRKDLWITIRFQISEKDLKIDVIDRGKGFKFPKYDLPDVGSTHGRGLFLIRSIMDDVSYKKRKNGNVLRMVYVFPEEEMKKSKGISEREVPESEAIEVLHDISRAIVVAGSLEEVCKAILARAAKALRVEKASIMKFDPTDDLLKIVAAKGIPLKVVGDARVKVGEGISGKVFKSMKPLLVEDIKTESYALRNKRYKSRSLISAPVTAFPMKIGGSPVGVFNMTDRKDGKPFTKRDLRLLTIIANQTASYLHIYDLAGRLQTAERMRRELEIARGIQGNLLPKKVPNMPGLDAAGSCLMAEKVGGDYFDFLAGGWAPPAIVIADVSGHDVGAAILMAAFRSALKSETAIPLLPPAVIMRRLNNMLFEDLVKAEQFISVCYVQYQNSTKTLRYTNAGHNPPLSFDSKNKKFSLLKTDDPLIGVVKSEHFHEKSCKLNKGAVVVMYTDGVVETANSKGVRFGYNRFKKVIRDNGKKSAKILVREITNAVKDFAGEAGIKDDVTVVVLKVK